MAAGLGRRMAPFTDELPKPLLPAGGPTFLDRGIRFMKACGIATVVINTHHLAPLIADHVVANRAFDMEVILSHEPQILGTGGGARRAAELAGGGGPLVILAADMVSNLDPLRLLGAHRAAGRGLTMVCSTCGDVGHYGAVRVAPDGRVVDIAGLVAGGGAEAGRPTVNASTHIIEEELLSRLPGQGECLVRDFYIPLMRAGITVNAHLHDGFWGEGGSPQRLFELNMNLLDLEQPAPMLHNDTVRWIGPAAMHPDTRPGREVTVGPHAVIGAGCVLGDGCTVQRSILLPGAVVDPGEVVTDTIRSKNHEWTPDRPTP